MVAEANKTRPIYSKAEAELRTQRLKNFEAEIKAKREQSEKYKILWARRLALLYRGTAVG